MNIKILVGYHKPAPLLKSDLFVPIHLGRAIVNLASKDGYASESDKKWMFDNLIGDNSGDNISNENRYYCEMTGIYWAWKNYEKLGNPDYIGFQHYRTSFFIDNKIHKQPFVIGVTQYKKTVTKDVLLSKLNKYHVINLAGIPKQDKRAYEYRKPVYQYLEQMYPEIYSAFKTQQDTDSFFYKNIFVMKKEDFFKYCSIVFDILSKYKNNSPREKGFVAEYLTSAYLFNLHQKYNDFNGCYQQCRIYQHPILHKLKLMGLRLLSDFCCGKLKRSLRIKYNQIKWS